MLNLDVAVVLNPHFGNRLIKLAQRLHVWICSSPENQPAVRAVWAIPELYETGRGATTFCKCEDPETIFLSHLETIDLHHPFWLNLEVYGLVATPQVQEALHEYGVTEVKNLIDGFIAIRLEQQGE